MRTNQIHLQLPDLLARDAHVCQLADPSGNGIGNFVVRHQRIHNGASTIHRFPCCGVEQHWPPLDCGVADLLERQVVPVNVESLQESFRLRL